MSSTGTVLYSAQDGYDEDAWDDTALIRAYDKALQSSRELIRVKSSGSAKKKRWEVGEQCRAVWEEDGEEYEGVVVGHARGGTHVTIRFHGYNNEASVRAGEVMESLGQEAVSEQVEQAEGEKEEEGAGEEFRLGDWCRAVWGEDGAVYEAVIEEVNMKKGTAKVKFVGFGDVEEKELEELYMSKGEDYRREQEQTAREEVHDLIEEDLHNLLEKNCPDLLANFGNVDGNEDSLSQSLDQLEIKKSLTKRSEKKSKKSGIKDSKSLKNSTEKSIPSTFAEFQQLSGTRSNRPTMTPSFDPRNPTFPRLPPAPFDLPSFHHPPGQYFSNGPHPSLAPPFSLPNMDQIDKVAAGDPALKALLQSWFNAGYYSGYFNGQKATLETLKNRKM